MSGYLDQNLVVILHQNVPINSGNDVEYIKTFPIYKLHFGGKLSIHQMISISGWVYLNLEL